MSVYIHSEYDKMIAQSDKNPIYCYFCGQPLKGTEDDIGGVVFWDGLGNPIAFHQKCSVLFSINLIQDARSLVSITGEEIKLVDGERKDRRDTWYYNKFTSIRDKIDIKHEMCIRSEKSFSNKDGPSMDFFSEKTPQIKPSVFEAFGIEISSRYGKGDEIIEMLQFSEKVALENNEKYILSVFYDSKSSYCKINLVSKDIPIEIKDKILEAAKKTIRQYRWDDSLD